MLFHVSDIILLIPVEWLLRLHIFQLFRHSQKFGLAENLGDQLNFKSAGPEDQLYFAP